MLVGMLIFTYKSVMLVPEKMSVGIFMAVSEIKFLTVRSVKINT